jgi:hypothetical protein
LVWLIKQGHFDVQNVVFAFSYKAFNYLINYVLEPALQSVPNIVKGPTKKNMVPAKNTAKKTKTPNI